MGLSLALVVLSLVVIALARPVPGLAVTQAVLKVQSSPVGVTIANPTCYTLASGTCGTTNWISKNTGGIPTTTYKYPLTATIGGTSYTLSANSLSGCNQGTAGSKPNICKVSVPGGSTATISANYTLTPSPPPFLACTANMVHNPSFEVINPATARTWGSWQAWEIFTNNSSEVPHWKRVSPGLNWAFVINNGIPPAGLIDPAFDGTKHAVLLGHSSSHPADELIGELSTPTTPGATYEMSAEISDSGYPGTTNFDLRLRNSTTGAESVPLTKAIGQQAVHWELINGHVTDNTSYDQVVLRYFGPLLPGHEVYGLFDDVHVCRVGGTTHWWQTGGGVVLALISLASGLTIWRSRRANVGGTSRKVGSVAVGDFNNDGVADRLDTRRKLGIAISILALGAGIYIAVAGGGVWKNQTTLPDNGTMTPASNVKCASNKHINDLLFTMSCDSSGKVIETKSAGLNHKTKASIVTPATAKTCADKETVKEGHKLFRNEKYKYCIQYLMEWSVNSTNAAEITFGTVPDGEPGPGWLSVTHFSDKTVATRTEEIMTDFKEPAGPCTETNSTLAGEPGRKLDCTGAANGEHHIFYIVSDKGGNLFELSYIGDMASSNTNYDARYKVIVDSFLLD